MHAESIKNISGLAGAPQNYPYTTNPLVNHNKSISCGAPASPGRGTKMTDYEKEKTEEKYWWISLLPSIASIIISVIVILNK
mgnify:CR=1 FL=1